MLTRPIAALALALALAACGGDDGPLRVEPSAIVVPEGQACSEQLEVPEMDSVAHVAQPEEVEYSTDPPTSGMHWPSPARTGLYDAPIPDEAAVHNLEHGHVIIQHNGLPPEELTKIESIVRADPVQMVLAPRPDMDRVLALTAWTVIQVCDDVPDDVVELVRAFVLAHRDNAPESIP